jgi:hypothetical protein
VTDLEYQDQDAYVLDLADQAIVSHAILPELAESLPLQGLSDTAGIVERGEARRKKP